MRYRVRPKGSHAEIPTKFNVFNARVDSLETRKTWRASFMKNHGICPFNSFYEWVEKDGKKSLISFKSSNHDFMWAPCLWEEWTSKDGSYSFKSFAIITNDPPPEIQTMGHDRCPIFIQKDHIDTWLQPKNKKDVYKILSLNENVEYSYCWSR